MGNELGRLIYRIDADTTGLNNSINASTGKVQNFGSKMAGMIPTALIIAAAAAAGKAILKLGTDAVETESKFGVVFSNVGAQAAMAVDELNKSYGMAKLTAQEMLSATGDILSGFGFNQGTALEFSSNIAKISTDIASFKNVQGGAVAVSEAVTKAMLGEREMLKTLGIAILEEDVKTQILKESKMGLVYESERQAKAAATYSLILERSANAQGDFARTSSTNANQIRVFSENLKDAGATIGKDLQPAISAVLQGLNSAFPKFINFINPLIPVFNKIGDVLGTAIKLAGELFEALQPVMVILGTILETSLTAADNVLSHVVSVVEEFNNVNEKVKSGGKELLSVYEATGEAAKNPQKAAEKIAQQIGIAVLEGRSLDKEVRKIAESTGYSVEQVTKYSASLGYQTEELKKQLGLQKDKLHLQLIENHIMTTYIKPGQDALTTAIKQASTNATALIGELIGADKTFASIRATIDQTILSNKYLNELQGTQNDNATLLAQTEALIKQYEDGIVQLKIDGAKMDASGNVKLLEELAALKEKLALLEPIVEAEEAAAEAKKKAADEDKKLLEDEAAALEAFKARNDFSNVNAWWDSYIDKIKEAASWQDLLNNSLDILGSAGTTAMQLIGESLATGKDNWTALADVAINAIADILSALGNQLAIQAVAALPNIGLAIAYGAGSLAAYGASALVRSMASSPDASGAAASATPPAASTTPEIRTSGSDREPMVFVMDDGTKLTGWVNRQIKANKIVVA